MKIKTRVVKKIISVFSAFLLLVNSFTPYLLITPTFNQVKAQEETVVPTPTAEPTIVPEEAPTPTPTVDVTPTSEPIISPTVAPTPVVTSVPEPTKVPSQWTFEKVELNKEYVSPQNNEVKLTFTKLPDPAGNIKIEEITLTQEQIKQTGSLSDKAYDITSDMKNGDFSYNLSLPIPESSKDKSVEVKFAEDISSIASAEKVENELTKTDTSVSVTNLDHLTIFVVVNPALSGPLCVDAGATTETDCYATIQAAIDAANNDDDIIVKNGTYLLPSTLQVNKEVTIIGESQGDTIINATGVGAGYGISISASNVTLKNFTITPNGASGAGYPIHVSNTPNLVSNLTLENITIDGSYRTAFDIHGVTGGSLKNLTAKNSSHGNGLSLTGSDTITVEGYTSSGNAWGGIALYNSQYTLPQRATHNINLKGNTFSISESIEIYEENEYGLTIAGITAEGYDFKVTNDTYRGSGSENFVHYKKNITDASSYALELQTNPSVIPNTASIIKQISTGDYYVVNGLKIQEAIAVANSGDTINVTAGTYVEAGQIVINKNLSIVGADKTTTIIKPAQDTTNSGDARGWFLVTSGVSFNLSNVTLDGLGHKIFQAIRDYGVGTIENSKFTNIKFNESGPDYAGTAIVAFMGSSGSVDVSNSEFSEIGRVGVLYFGTGKTGTYSGNTYVGKGSGNWLDYGVEVGAGATVTISNNSISNDIGVATVDGSTSAGILVTTYFGNGTQAIITGNTLINNADGIAVGYDASDTSTVIAHNNNLSENVEHGVISTAPDVDATENWWGDQSGPSDGGTGIGDSVSTNVTFSPWCLNSDCSLTSSIYSSSKGVNLGASQDVTVGDLTLENITGTGSLFVAKYDTVPSTGGLSTGVDGFYYDIQASGIDFPVSITLNYSDTLGASNYLDENHFNSLYYYKDGSWHDYKLDTQPSNILINKTSDIISATLYHLTPIVPGLDTISPVITWDYPNDGDVLQAPVVLQAHANETLENLRFKWQLVGDTWNTGYNISESKTNYDYSFDPGIDGIYNLRAQGRDLVLNFSKADDIQITIDNTKPTGVISTPANGEFVNGNLTVTGSVNDNLSGIDKVKVRLRNYPGNTYRTDWVSAALDGSNNYSVVIDTTVIPDDVYEVAVVAYDNAGNNKWLNPRPIITVDKTAPAKPTGLTRFTVDDLTEYSCGSISQRQTLIPTWTANSETDFDHYEYTSFNSNGSIGLNEQILTTNEFVHSWVPTSDGVFGYAVRAVDKTGNKSDWSLTGKSLAGSCQITYDSVVPTGTISYSTTALTNGNVIATLVPSETITVTNNGGSTNYTFTANGTFTFNFEDLAGNTGTATATVSNIDKTAPVVAITAPTTTLVKGNVEIRGTVTDTNPHHYWLVVQNSSNATVAGPGTVNDSTSFTDKLFFTWNTNLVPDGVYKINLAARDAANNRDSGSAMIKTVTVDNTAPTITINNFITNDNTPKLTGTVDDNTASISIEVDGKTFTATNKGDGTWELANDTITPVLADNIYNVIASATDTAGNIGTDTTTNELTVDTVAPTATYKHYINGTEFLGSIAYVNDINKLTFTGEYSDAIPSSQLLKDSYVIFDAQADGSFKFSQNGAKAYCGWRTEPNLVNLSGNPFSLTVNESFANCKNDLGEGEYYMTHQVYDNAVRKDIPIITQFRDVLGLHFIIDKTAPIITVNNPNTLPAQSKILTASVSDGTLMMSETTGTVCDSTLTFTSYSDKTYSLESDNGKRVCYQAQDAANNFSYALSDVISGIDTTNPSSIISSPTNDGPDSVVYSSDWDGTVAGTASDNVTVDHVELSIKRSSDNAFWNGTAWIAGTESAVRVPAIGTTSWSYILSGPTEDSYTIRSHAVDNAGNMESTYTLTIILDKTIPEVAISLNPAVADAQNGWYKTQPEVTLTATDTNIDKIEYQWNSQTGVWTTYSVPFKPGSEGANILYYRAQDKAGNYSDIGIKNIKWDQTELTDGPLNMSISPNPTSGTTSVVKWEEADDNTGIDRYEVKWSLKDGNKTYMDAVGNSVREHTIDNLTEGVWNVYVTAFDGSGNSKNASADLTVDQTGPSAPQLSVLGTDVGSVSLGWTKIDEANDYIIWYGTTPGSYLYGAKVGDIQNYTVQGLGAGSYYFIVKAVDSSGNQSGNSNEVSTGAIVGAPGVAENTPAEGFAENVLGEATESAKLTPTGTVLGTETKSGSSKKLKWWQWVLLSLFTFGGAYFGYKKWKKKNT